MSLPTESPSWRPELVAPPTTRASTTSERMTAATWLILMWALVAPAVTALLLDVVTDGAFATLAIAPLLLLLFFGVLATALIAPMLFRYSPQTAMTGYLIAFVLIAILATGYAFIVLASSPVM